MEKLTPAQRRAHRAKAHALHPVVSIGREGLTPAVLHEIDVALTAHELIKIRVFKDDRAEREAMLLRVCTEMEALPVQHVGKIIVVFRPAPEAAPPPAETPKRIAKGKAPPQRRRAPATTKGPFEPGRRPPRDRGAPAPPGEVGVRRRRTSTSGAQAAGASQTRRRTGELGAPTTGAGQSRRRPNDVGAPTTGAGQARRRTGEVGAPTTDTGEHRRRRGIKAVTAPAGGKPAPRRRRTAS